MMSKHTMTQAGGDMTGKDQMSWDDVMQVMSGMVDSSYKVGYQAGRKQILDQCLKLMDDFCIRYFEDMEAVKAILRDTTRQADVKTAAIYEKIMSMLFLADDTHKLMAAVGDDEAMKKNFVTNDDTGCRAEH